MIGELTNQIQAGESIDLEEWVRRFPSCASELRELVPTMCFLNNLSRGLGEERAVSGETESAAGSVLGDFRILREVGRGGMGVVYEAEQLSLRRRVAMKVLPFAGVLDQRQLQRFRNESQAAASLRHPNIVQIFSVGCERGVHYFAMEFIEGRTLGELIDRLRPAQESARTAEFPGAAIARERGDDNNAAAAADTDRIDAAEAVTQQTLRSRQYLRNAVRLGIQAAEALDHAHNTGVVHRDIKPSNLLVDDTGKLFITDFGLATTQSATNITVSGDVLGTLRYMSPEQASGRVRVVDHRTDIYSLGTTLYELLTSIPAFPGQDRHTLLHAVGHDEPKPVRQLNTAVPKDLETIVMKAMAKEPSARYETAQQLADDLQRFLADEPIHARHPSPLNRLGKWTRRHWPLISVAAALLVVAVIGLSASTFLVWREQVRTASALAHTKAARDDALRASEEAAAVLAFVTDDLLAAADPNNARGLSITVDDVLARAEQRIDGAFPKDPLIEAAVRQTLGKIYLRCGQYASAERHLLRAKELHVHHCGADGPEMLRDLAGLAAVHLQRGDLEQVRELTVQVLETRKRVLGERHRETLISMGAYAELLRAQGHLDQARELCEQTLQLQTSELGKDAPATLTSALLLTQILYECGEWREASRICDDTLPRLLEVLGGDHPLTLGRRRSAPPYG